MPIDYGGVFRSIARAIEALKPDFPQLADFSADEACRAEGDPSIDYAFRTHRAARRAGWTSGVPNPDDDGVWFHIDAHDPDSQSQIHTQPVMVERLLGGKRIAFLLLEGRKTRSLEAALSDILSRHGVQTL